MELEPDDWAPWRRRMTRWAAVIGAAVAIAALLVLVFGWWLDITLIREPLPGGAMKANNALISILIGIGIVAIAAWRRNGMAILLVIVAGVIAGVTLATTPEVLMRAGLEAVALRLALIHRLLAPQLANGHAVIANGGALLGSPVWQRIACDALGVPLTILASTDETAARGAAVLALEAHGTIGSLADASDPVAGRPVIEPDPAAHERYRLAGDRQRALLDALLTSGLWTAD